ncbi:MAG: hypothetical protein H0T89_36380 [Deltaproteobacteria bacterium]|nr:hypothetical protein [Deltaproteobacteria bacterium]MDQ3300548.1 hypothetical protein [Myxococcota bacterium]
MRQRLHLVRTRATAEPAVLDDRDWVVYLNDQRGLRLAPHGAPPVPAGPIDHAQLVQLLERADLVVTW